jgi:hypothetical protein
MLRPVSLVKQWQKVLRELPENWADARLRLTVEDERKADRAATALAPLTPGRRGSTFRFYTARGGAGPAPGLVERLLARLDDLRLMDPGALSYVESFIIRGLNDLPFRFRRRA